MASVTAALRQLSQVRLLHNTTPIALVDCTCFKAGAGTVGKCFGLFDRTDAVREGLSY